MARELTSYLIDWLINSVMFGCGYAWCRYRLAAEKSKWWPSPCGKRLELGATGYWIQLVGRQGKLSYAAFDPEGDCLARGEDLKTMKQGVEQFASFRSEFTPSKKDTTPILTLRRLAQGTKKDRNP